MESLALVKKIALGTCMMLALGAVGRFTGPLWAADEIKLGVLSTAGDHWPRWVAWEQGFFKQQNLEVREFQTDSIAKAVQALSANSTDLLFPANTQGVVVAMSKGAGVNESLAGYMKQVDRLSDATAKLEKAYRAAKTPAAKNQAVEKQFEDLISIYNTMISLHNTLIGAEGRGDLK